MMVTSRLSSTDCAGAGEAAGVAEVMEVAVVAARLLVSATPPALAGPVCQSNAAGLTADTTGWFKEPARATLPPNSPKPPSTSAPAIMPSASVGAAGRRCTRRRTRLSRAPRRPMAASASRGAVDTTALWLHSARAVRARASRSGSPPTRTVAVSSQQFSRSVRTQLAINQTAG